MEVSAQAIVARNKHYVSYGRDCTFGCYSVLGRLYFGLRILSHDILDRFTNHIALLVGTHTMSQIRNTLIACTVL